MCQISLVQPISMYLEKDDHTRLIAQRFPSFKNVSLLNECVLTCDEQKDGLGGIVAFESTNILIDGTSKIDVSGKGTSKDFSNRVQNQEYNTFYGQVRPLTNCMKVYVILCSLCSWIFTSK